VFFLEANFFAYWQKERKINEGKGKGKENAIFKKNLGIFASFFWINKNNLN
jgi:hypothetical protein